LGKRRLASPFDQRIKRNIKKGPEKRRRKRTTRRGPGQAARRR
jgi:hypothetical protein